LKTATTATLLIDPTPHMANHVPSHIRTIKTSFHQISALLSIT
jgi:hypothetical protein